MITNKTPRLDLHGEITSMVEVLVNEFINDNKLCGINEVIIIHGKSTNILTEEVHKVQKVNVSRFRVVRVKMIPIVICFSLPGGVSNKLSW